jgi:O-methyltransferase involved in polyketide biosynthesis
VSSDRISPTAHYTAYVWARNGLSHPRLETREGRLLYESLRGVMAASAALGGNSLERYLLARHRSIDLLLERAIESGSVAQVIEVACGLSARGWRFSSRYGERIQYVEADLPEMAERKRRALADMGSLSEHHRVVVLDALASAGPESLAGVAAGLDRGRGTAVITEGLLGYLDGGDVLGLWRRVASALTVFPSGLYLSDLHLGAVQDLPIRAFRLLLSAFVRGSVHLHFQTAEEAVAQLRAAGFDPAAVRRAADVLGAPEGGASDRLDSTGGRAADTVDSPDGRAGVPRGANRRGGGQLVHIIEASTVRSQ